MTHTAAKISGLKGMEDRFMSKKVLGTAMLCAKFRAKMG
jgi:hypothetical protein